MSRGRTAVLLIFLASLVFQTTFIGLDVFPSDEGLPLVAAEDVANGKLLYRECYVPVTPLAYLVQAGVFKLFGAGVLQSRLLLAVLNATSVVMVFAIATTCLPFRFAVLGGLAAIPLQLWAWPHAQFFSYTPLAVTLSLVAMRLAWDTETRSSRLRWVVLFGGALGLSIWAKPNIGIMAGGGVLAYWMTGVLRTVAGVPGTTKRSISDLMRDGVTTIFGMSLVSTPVLVHLIATGTLDDMIESLMALAAIYNDVPPDLFPSLFPMSAQIEGLRVNPGLIIPGVLSSSLMWNAGYAYVLANTVWIDWLVRGIYYTPIALQGLVAACLLWRLRRNAWSKEDDAALLALLVTFCLYLTIVPHAAVHYLLPAQLPAVVLGCFIHFRATGISRPWIRFLARATCIGCWTIYFAVSILALGLYVSVPRDPVRTEKGTVWLEPVQAHALRDLLSYASEEIPSTAKAFVFPYYPLFYFLSGVEHATRFVDLRPGSPGIAAEDEIIHQLELEHVEFAIYVVGTQYPGIESFHDAYPRLNHYLSTRFELDRTIRTFFGTFAEIRRRRHTDRTDRSR